MKSTFLLLVLIIACSKPSGSSKNPARPNPMNTPVVEDIVDPLVTPDQQQQTDQDFELVRTYNGVNVVLNYNSSQNLGMIRIKDKDADKLNKHMALSLIKVNTPRVKNEIEAKVGKNVACRPDTCWIYIDYKNGEILENERTSQKAKAKKLGRNYSGPTLDLVRDVNMDIDFRNPDVDVEVYHKATIKISGQDAKALYSVMALGETEAGGKGAVKSQKIGKGIVCTRSVSEKNNKTTAEYKCEAQFNFRSGALKDSEE